MKYLFFLFILSFTVSGSSAQDAAQLQENAHTFMRQGDYTNAILVLNHAAEKEPTNIAISKDLVLCYIQVNDAEKALGLGKALTEREDADEQCYMLLGDIYSTKNDSKESEKAYKKGIKKFPSSGALYNSLGRLLLEQKDNTAIRQWETGIEKAPNYPGNYYEACKFYYFTADWIWSLYYGEIFLNMESGGSRSPEIKEILLEGYKKFFQDDKEGKNTKDSKGFATLYKQTLMKQKIVASSGISVESLIMIRTRFILDWFNGPNEKFACHLFELQQQYLQEGLSDAYNQWIFGSVQNLASYQNWTKIHATESNEFSRFLQNRMFKVPDGQYYH